jgi:hypothetical protein
MEHKDSWTNRTSRAERRDAGYAGSGARALRRVVTGVVVAAAWAGAPGPVSAQDGTPLVAASLAPFAWMAGCWEGVLSSGALYEEWWMSERGGMMQGVARMTREGRTLTFEFMAMRVEDGNPVFMAQPAGAPTPTRFPLARAEGPRWTFENPEHDFPQRVIYADPARGSAPFARIEGESDGAPRALDFPLTRTACPR